MHDAYCVKQILRLPLDIECITAFSGDRLIVGTKQGHILMYTIKIDSVGAEPQVQLLRSNKYFSKKPILQLAVIPEYSILIALTDNVVSVHDIDLAVTNFQTITTVNRSRGAHLFAVSRNSGQVHMVVAIRKRLIFFVWTNRSFQEIPAQDTNLPDHPRAIVWAAEESSLCLCFRSEYVVMEVGPDGANRIKPDFDVVPIGLTSDPHITLLMDRKYFALATDDGTVFIDLNGKRQLNSTSWSETPRQIVYDSPYLLAAVGPKGLEVRTHIDSNISKNVLVQTNFELIDLKLIVICKPGLLFCASSDKVWSLEMFSISNQIQHLIDDKQFELAISLQSLMSTTPEHDRLKDIHVQFAFHLFISRRFFEAMEQFYTLNVDVSHVIGLIHNLLPQKFSNDLSYPDEVPLLQGVESTNAKLALIEYLIKVRYSLHDLALFSKSHIGKIEPTPIPLASSTSKIIQSRSRILQIIDTTLLKCYLETNDSLVIPLLRMKDNNCHLEETQRELRKYNKLSELIIFFNSKGQHHEALQLLKDQCSNSESSLSGFTHTVEYLQNLGPENFSLILETTQWLLKQVSDGPDGDSVVLQIFTADVHDVEELPRKQIYEFLLKHRSSIVVKYLEHIIFVWLDSNAIFHDALIINYKNEFMKLHHKQKSQLSSALKDESIDQHSLRTELTDLKNSFIDDKIKEDEMEEKILKLLKFSNFYTTEIIYSQFPTDCLYLCRAVLLELLGRREEALFTFLYQLRDLPRALEHCKTHDDSSDIYTTLVLLMLAAPSVMIKVSDYALSLTSVGWSTQSIIEVLEAHGNNINFIEVLEALPEDIQLTEIRSYLTSGLLNSVAKLHHSKLRRAVLNAQYLQLQETRLSLEKNKFVVSQTDCCCVCAKCFLKKGAAFVRFPSGQICHLYCQEKMAAILNQSV